MTSSNQRRSFHARRISSHVKRALRHASAERWGPVIVLSSIALLLTYVSNIKFIASLGLQSLLLNIGMGFFSAAVIAGTIEFQSQRKRSEFIEDAVQSISNATVDLLLQSFTPDPKIFNEIKESVFNKEYYRLNYEISARFSEHTEDGYLVFTKTVQYTIKNTAASQLDYNLCVAEEMEGKFAESTEIGKVYHGITSHSFFPRTNELTLLEPRSATPYPGEPDEPERLKYFENQVSIPPNYFLHVKFTTSKVVREYDKDVIVSTSSSTGLTFEITHHPSEISFIAFPLRPSSASLSKRASDEHMVRWVIDDGLLPGQGLHLSWSPRKE